MPTFPRRNISFTREIRCKKSIPHQKHEETQFLELTDYYINHYTSISHTLTQQLPNSLLPNTVEQNHFKELKRCLQKPPILIYPDPRNDTTLN